jgi:hypothetical protein
MKLSFLREEGSLEKKAAISPIFAPWIEVTRCGVA